MTRTHTRSHSIILNIFHTIAPQLHSAHLSHYAQFIIYQLLFSHSRNFSCSKFSSINSATFSLSFYFLVLRFSSSLVFLFCCLLVFFSLSLFLPLSDFPFVFFLLLSLSLISFPLLLSLLSLLFPFLILFSSFSLSRQVAYSHLNVEIPCEFNISV